VAAVLFLLRCTTLAVFLFEVRCIDIVRVAFIVGSLSLRLFDTSIVLSLSVVNSLLGEVVRLVDVLFLVVCCLVERLI
jgi:hypothetical protein